MTTTTTDLAPNICALLNAFVPAATLLDVPRETAITVTELPSAKPDNDTLRRVWYAVNRLFERARAGSITGLKVTVELSFMASDGYAMVTVAAGWDGGHFVASMSASAGRNRRIRAHASATRFNALFGGIAERVRGLHAACAAAHRY